MEYLFSSRRIMIFTLVAFFLSSCVLDPNTRKQKYMQSGQSLFEKGKYNEAVIQYTNAIKIDGNNAEARYQLAETYLRLQQRDKAYQELVRTVELQPENDQARMELANMLVVSRNFQQAQDHVNLLLKKKPNDAGTHSLAASLMASQSKFPEAIAETKLAIALAPGHWEAYLSLGLLQMKNNELYDAEASFKKVIELNPKATQARLTLGSFYQSQKRMEEAEKQYRDAMALDAQAIEPRQALVRLYLIENKKDAAEGMLKQTVHDLPDNPESYLGLSNFYYLTGDLDKSVAEYQTLYQRSPKDLTIKKKYIELLIETKHYDDARRVNDEILKSNPKDDDALVASSQLQIISGDVNTAAKTLQTVIKNTPNNVQAHFALGVALKEQGRVERAVTEWREALRLNPNFVDAQRKIAAASVEQNDMNALRDAANQIIRLEPGLYEGYAMLGLANLNTNHLDLAEQDIHKAISLDPEQSMGYVQLGNLRLLQKKYSEAVTAYQQALDRNANSTDALRGLSSSYIAQHQIDRAIAVLKTQIGKAPNNSKFYALLGGVLFLTKQDFAGAEAAYTKSISLDTHNYDARFQLCQVRAANGQIDQAIAAGEQSLKEYSLQPNLSILMGGLYQSKSDWKKAESAYKNALAINSQNPEASNGLARVILNTNGNLDLAMALAQTARKGLPDSAEAADTLGWIYLRKGVYPLAIDNLKEALKLQDKSDNFEGADIHFHLGSAYKLAGQTALARQHFEIALKLNPNHTSAAEIKESLAAMKL